MADPIPLNAYDQRVDRLYDQVETLIDTELRRGNITIAAAIGIIEMIKLTLYTRRAAALLDR